MAEVVLRDKLESLRRAMARIESHRAPSAEVLRGDIDRQDILSLNLTRALQLCVDMAVHLLADRGQPAPRSMGEAFSALAEAGIIEPALAERMRAAVGFRNIAVHSYRSIDWEIVQRICADGLDDFKAFARAVAAGLS